MMAFASEPRTIRVGYFAFPGFHELHQSENGPQGSGYGFDFLQMLRRYTNLNYQYIGYENSWLDMQQMLRDVQKSLDAGMNAHLSKPIVMEEVMKPLPGA